MNIGAHEWNVLTKKADEENDSSKEHENEEERNINISGDGWDGKSSDNEYDADGSHKGDSEDDWYNCLNDG